MFDIDPEEYYRQSRGFQLPLGLRSSRNPFNIKYYKGAERDQGRWPGLLGPSTARDQGDPQMLFSDLESGGRSAAQLLLRKYQGGARTANDIIAGRSGWTPGYGAAATSVANFAGVRPDQDLALNTAEGMRRFLPALFRQEQGPTAARMMNPGLFDRIVAGLNFGGGAPRAALGVPAPLAQVPTPPEIMAAARTQYPGRIGALGGPIDARVLSTTTGRRRIRQSRRCPRHRQVRCPTWAWLIRSMPVGRLKCRRSVNPTSAPDPSLMRSLACRCMIPAPSPRSRRSRSSPSACRRPSRKTSH